MSVFQFDLTLSKGVPKQNNQPTKTTQNTCISTENTKKKLNQTKIYRVNYKNNNCSLCIKTPDMP